MAKTHRLREVLAKRLRAERAKKKWSQEVLAEKAGVHRTYIGFVERAEIAATIDKVEDLANALGLSGHDLIT